MKWMMVLALAVAPLWGQDPVHKLVNLRYVDPVAARELLKNFGVNVVADRQMKVVALSGHKANVETAEAALAQLDKPNAALKDVELTVYFVLGRDEAGPGSVNAIPADLQSTVAALKQTFPYKAYELLDTLALRSRAGSNAHTTGQIGGNRLTHFSVNSVNLEGDGSMIRIDGLNAGVRQLQNLGSKSEYVNVSGVSTQTVDVKEGQKLVVGRASEGPGKALFLVLIAKVAQ
jgi:hypothetical protein